MSIPTNPLHECIEELKSIKRKCIIELRRYYDEDNFGDDEEFTLFAEEFTLLELFLETLPLNQILNYKMLIGQEDLPEKEVDFDEFLYDIYKDYLNIYDSYGYDRTPLNIPNHIMEEYLERREMTEQELRVQQIYDGFFPDEPISYFKNEFRIPEQQVLNYRKRIQEQYEKDLDNWG
jgi:hypothetical protein